MWLLMRHYLLIEAVMKESRNQKWNVHGDWFIRRNGSNGFEGFISCAACFSHVWCIFFQKKAHTRQCDTYLLTYAEWCFRKRCAHVSVLHVFSSVMYAFSERGADTSVCFIFLLLVMHVFQTNNNNIIILTIFACSSPESMLKGRCYTVISNCLSFRW